MARQFYQNEKKILWKGDNFKPLFYYYSKYKEK